MYTGTNLCCCPSNMVFSEFFVGKYWLIFIKLKALYLCVESREYPLYLIRRIRMAELEAIERSVLNPRCYFLYFFRRIVAPGWYGWGNREVNLQLWLVIKPYSYTSAVTVSVFSNCWALCAEKVIWGETLCFLADYELLSRLLWSKSLGYSWV